MKRLRAELHTHTVLSPCASVEMIPPLIISEAKSKQIDILAVTDHNSIANIESVMQAAAGTEITVLPGIELQTREEVHSICLFDTFDQVQAFFSFIEPSLPDINNKADYFGEQFVVDKTGEFIRREERMLISSAELSLSQAYYEAQRLGGLFIPAHINRSAYGLLPVLGFIPQDIELDIVEISKHLDPKDAITVYPQLENCFVIQNGDAHFLDEIQGFNEFEIDRISIEEISQAIRFQNDRKYRNLFSKIIHKI